VACPTFESCLLKWMIKTYQPLWVTECNEFRMMCLALNKNSPILGSNRLCRLLKSEYHLVQVHPCYFSSIRTGIFGFRSHNCQGSCQASPPNG
jgi:hypothetical protein